MLILGIETSCDETAASLVSANDKNIKVLSNIVSSQTKLHAEWGGVVPNLAAREHVKNIKTVLDLAFKKSKTKPKDVDLITVTNGPGLIPALLVGTNAARTLSYVWQKPLLGIHHIEGHIYANFISNKISVNHKSKILNPNSDTKFPILCLVVSGGHTQLIYMKSHLNYKIVGETLDDAAGEAFDKVARILGLGYPGGPAIAAEAANFEIRNSKFETSLPRPLINSKDLNFSFSGLKTAVLYKTKEFRKLPVTDYRSLVTVLAHEFQQAVVDVLVLKTIKAAKELKPKTIMIAGGVAANKELRKQLGKAVKKELSITDYQLPITDYSIDNAAMIAAAGYFRWMNMDSAQKKKGLNNWKTLEADANLKLK